MDSKCSWGSYVVNLEKQGLAVNELSYKSIKKYNYILKATEIQYINQNQWMD